MKMGQGITRVGEGVLTGWGKGLCREPVRGGYVCWGGGGGGGRRREEGSREVKFLTSWLA